METRSELQSVVKATELHSRDSEFFSHREDHKWLLEEISLRELHERKQAGFPEIFTAVIDDVLYVADDEIISLWRENDEGKLLYLNVIYWDDIAEQTFVDSKLLRYTNEIPEHLRLFHDKMSLLFSLREGIRRLRTPYYEDCIDGWDYHNWVCDSTLEDREFKDHQRYLMKLLKPILNSLPDGYETVMQAQRERKEREKKERMKQHQACNSEMATDIDLEFFKNLR
jgi:hypothetical protein